MDSYGFTDSFNFEKKMYWYSSFFKGSRRDIKPSLRPLLLPLMYSYSVVQKLKVFGFVEISTSANEEGDQQWYHFDLSTRIWIVQYNTLLTYLWSIRRWHPFLSHSYTLTDRNKKHLRSHNRCYLQSFDMEGKANRNSLLVYMSVCFRWV